jgi:hypothetical protein
VLKRVCHFKTFACKHAELWEGNLPITTAAAVENKLKMCRTCGDDNSVFLFHSTFRIFFHYLEWLHVEIHRHSASLSILNETNLATSAAAK